MRKGFSDATDVIPISHAIPRFHILTSHTQTHTYTQTEVISHQAHFTVQTPG